MLRKGDLVRRLRQPGRGPFNGRVGIVVGHPHRHPYGRALVRWMWGDMILTNEHTGWLEVLVRGSQG